MCISKGLTGGYIPIAITVTTENIYQAFYADYNEGKAFMHSHTYSGNPWAVRRRWPCRRSCGRIEFWKKRKRGRPISTAGLWRRWAVTRMWGEIRHLGLINAIELVEDRELKRVFAGERRMGYQIYQRALKRGLLLRPLGNVLYFNPPLVIEENDGCGGRTIVRRR